MNRPRQQLAEESAVLQAAWRGRAVRQALIHQAREEFESIAERIESSSLCATISGAALNGVRWPAPIVQIEWPQSKTLCQPVVHCGGLQACAPRLRLEAATHQVQGHQNLQEEMCGLADGAQTEKANPPTCSSKRQQQLEGELWWALQAIASRKQHLRALQ